MKKILFAAMAALILCSVFVGIKMANTTVANGMEMNPAILNTDPTPSNWNFLYELNITTAVTQVTAWEAKVLWNPEYLRILGVVWGDWMKSNVTVGITNSSVLSSGSEYIILGQNYDDQKLDTTGGGTLAYLNLTFNLPGMTFVKIVEATVWNDAMDVWSTKYGNFSKSDGRVQCSNPRPLFSWTTADTRNPLPTHSVYDGGDSLANSDLVLFNAAASYDVGGCVWNVGTGTFDLPADYDIKKLRWEYGDGAWDYIDATNFTLLANHTYSAYKYEGWTVNLTVWDSENQFWSSTWTYYPKSSNTVPMWRDVGIVDIWPSLIPYQNWDTIADDWYAYWWYDSTDFWLPGPNDPYWNYALPDSYCDSYGWPLGTTVKQAWALDGILPSTYGDEGPGLNILVTANNYGSVSEKVAINLYAIGVQTKIKALPAGTPNQIISVEQIGSWKKTIAKGAGTGWGCTVNWMPSKNMTYVLMATIEAQDNATFHDGNYADNYFYLTSPVSNIAIWNTTSVAYVPHTVTWGEYFADQNGDGKVNYVDLGYITGNNYGLKNLSPSWKNLLPKP
jgi:hypothetical protein